MEVWTALAASTLGSTTFTITFASNFDDASFICFSLKDCYPSSPFDSNVSLPSILSSNSSSWTPSFTISTDQADDLLFYFVGSGTNDVPAAPSGFAYLDSSSNGGGSGWSKLYCWTKSVSALQSSQTFTASAAFNVANSGGAGESIFDALTAVAPPAPPPPPPPPPAPAPAPTYGVGLPSITAPSGCPVFLADGHGIDEDSLYAQVPMATGHSRTRKRYTVTDRVVTVRWLLEPALLTAVDDWYENTLLAGTRQFAARVRNQGAGPALLWWRARWIDFSTELMHLGRGLVSGRLLLTGEGQVDGPETGALAMEVSVALLDIRSSVAVQAHLAMEILVALLQPLELAMEIEVALLSDYIATFGRITEDGESRVTEDGDARLIEA
jgi:hypothetical protein